MIKSLIQRVTLLGVIGTTCVSSSLIMPKVLALPTETISQKLNSVRVFFIGDEQGNFAYGYNDRDRRRQVGIFISRQEANKVLTLLQSQNPNFARKAKIYHSSLGHLYKIAQNNDYKLIYIPNEQAVHDTKAILGKRYKSSFICG